MTPLRVFGMAQQQVALRGGWGRRLRLIVVFRSAKERPFAERKATLFNACSCYASSTSSEPRRVFWSLWAVVLLGMLIRTAAMLRGPAAFDDPDNYLPLARSLLAGDGFTWKGRPTAYRPPLYPASPGTLDFAIRVAILPGASPCFTSGWEPARYG